MTYTKSRQDIDTFYARTDSRLLILFGAGEMAMRFINRFLRNRPIAYICDNDPEKQGTKLYGVDVVSPAVLSDVNPDDTVILITSLHVDEIRRQLDQVGKGFDVFSARSLLSVIFTEVAAYFFDHPGEIVETLDMLHDEKSKWIFREVIRRKQTGYSDYGDLIVPGTRPYILPEAFADSRPRDEIIIDAGAYDGDNIKDFIYVLDASLAKIYAFEPDHFQFSKLEELKQQIYYGRAVHPEIILSPCGLADQNMEMEFSVCANKGWSFISDNRILANLDGKVQERYAVKVVRLDDVIPKNEKITLIKMDIEGSEFNALLGAKEIIKTYKPRLAISIYHHGADYIRIPKLVKEFVPEYKISIRHHNKNSGDTVMYAYI